MEQFADVIIIGAGICGLVAARELANEGKKVLIVEARDRTGGRVASVKGPFSEKLEIGAEFMHGKLSQTIKLLKESDSKYYKKKGNIYLSKEGKISKTNNFIPKLRRLTREIKKLQSDVPLSKFLAHNFNGKKNKELKENVIRAAEGFDAADIERLSTFSVRDEWARGLDIPFRVKSYGDVIDFLVSECDEGGVHIYLSNPVKEIEWKEGSVKVKSGENTYYGLQVIITVPLGVITSNAGEKGHIRFLPSIPGKINAAKLIGYGSVIKVHFEFKTAFWENKEFKRKCAQVSNLGFIANESEFPMWWTNEASGHFLTGWVAGSAADHLKNCRDEQLYNAALGSLANALFCSAAFLREQLAAYKITNWFIDPYSRGAYSYKTPETDKAKKILLTPVHGTIYFAGEALGDNAGTVESAISSGLAVAKKSMQITHEYA